MNKHVTIWLQTYHDGELHGRRLRQVERHLSQCAACRVELDTLQRLSLLLQENREPEPLLRPEQFIAQVGLKLPRHQKRPVWQSVSRASWLLIPPGLLGILIFVQTTFIVSGAILNALRLGSKNVTDLLPVWQQNAWQANIAGLLKTPLTSAVATMLRWLESGGTLGWVVALNYGLLVIIGLLYWSWLAGWWAYQKHKTGG